VLTKPGIWSERANSKVLVNAQGTLCTSSDKYQVTPEVLMEVVMNTELHATPVQTYPTSVHNGIYQTTRRHAQEHICLQINSNMASLK